MNNKALEYALNLLGKKDYSEAELRQKFSLREIQKEEADQAILFLKDKSFIDDRRFAENYRKIHYSRGDIRIKYELIKKGISSEIIEHLLAASDESDQIERAVEVASDWFKKKKDKYEDKYKLKTHLIAKLSRQGFGYSIICQALEKLNI